MSEFKRYTESCMEGGGVVESKNGEFVDYSTYAGAQAELSALREELAKVQAGFKWESERAALLLETLTDAEDSLTATEQRNAELSALVDRAYELEYIDGDWVDEYRRIKPTESGASE